MRLVLANNTGLQFTVKVSALADNTFAVASCNAECAGGGGERVSQKDSGFRRTRYQLLVQRALWRLGLRQNSRIFLAQKPDEILSILLQEHVITDYAFALKNEHAQREYCVQYRKTDLDFVNHLATEEGRFYFHEFARGKHRIVFADDAAALTQGSELFFNLGNRSLEQGASVRQFHYREPVPPSDVELKDASFKTRPMAPPGRKWAQSSTINEICIYPARARTPIRTARRDQTSACGNTFAPDRP